MTISEFYPLPVSEIREKYYPNLANQTYLDHAGTTVYSSLTLDKIHEVLSKTLLANPHSLSSASRDTASLVEETRYKILSIFHADPAEYDIVFSLNATHAIKIAASLIQDAAENSFNYYYNINCHTSLIGLRTLAAKYATFDDISSFEPVEDKDGNHPALNFVSWTGQSNFNGQKFPLGWCKEFRRRLDHCYTLYDASALSTSDPPDLSDANSSPDFVVMSFYKIFGMPDIGALILRRSTAKQLVEKRRYFGGGTIDALTIEEPFCRRSKQLHQSLEDGTIPVHAILELSVAIDSHYQIFGSFNSIRLHTDEIRKYAICKLKQLKYGNTGRRMLQIYDWPGAKHGPIIAFSLLSPAGDPIGYYGFGKLASARNISLRTGTLCNIGGIQKFLDRTNEDIRQDYEKGHKCGDILDIIDGKPTGVIRVSFGAMTMISEIDTLVKFITEYLKDSNLNIEEGNSGEKQELVVKSLTVYPIKSCPGYRIPEGRKWKLTKHGFEFDRSFVLLDLLTQKPLLLKNNPRMALLDCRVDPEKHMLYVRDKRGGNKLWVSTKIRRYKTKQMGDFIAISERKMVKFFSDVMSIGCTLAGFVTEKQMQNKTAFLLVNERSMRQVSKDDSLISRFRANIVVDSAHPYIEDKLSVLTDMDSGVVLKKRCKCDRCYMITVSDKGSRDPSLLVELSKERKQKGKVYFGVNIDVENVGYRYMRVGDRIVGEE